MHIFMASPIYIYIYIYRNNTKLRVMAGRVAKRKRRRDLRGRTKSCREGGIESAEEQTETSSNSSRGESGGVEGEAGVEGGIYIYNI